MRDTISRIFHALISSHGGTPFPTGVDILAQFNPDAAGEEDTAQSLNAALLMAMSGPKGPRYQDAITFIQRTSETKAWAQAIFLRRSVDEALREMEERCDIDAAFRRRVEDLAAHMTDASRGSDDIGAVRRVFFPEGFQGEDIDGWVESVRRRRMLRITEFNPAPIQDPGRDILFTANALATLPSPDCLERIAMDDGDKRALEDSWAAGQRYWYDHPTPVGTAPEHNELAYGVQNLAEAVAFEKRHGGLDPQAKITLLVSVSPTHTDVSGPVGRWIKRELSRVDYAKHINLYLVTEEDCLALLEQVLIPAAKEWLGCDDAAPLIRVFGVEGEYGRHYSFLKAAAAFWRVFIDRKVKATFKIDLDQVFPQDELIRETGATAFGHFRSPLWGASAQDSWGNNVRLGMTAGLLVNRNDIESSLFTPDVRFPLHAPVADEMIFRSAEPQAVSTLAEMGTRYREGSEPDGRTTALQRVHVTGGTTGILIEDLIRYRPFSPTFITRAEDQAYLMPVMFHASEGAFLRYLHSHGLVMRHDADLFTDAALDARLGKMAGDIARMILFSGLARALPWGAERVKRELDPFTGSFISPIPITIAMLRLTLRTAQLFASGAKNDAVRFFRLCVARLEGPMRDYAKGLSQTFEQERAGWEIYYDVIQEFERRLAECDAAAVAYADRAVGIINRSKCGL